MMRRALSMAMVMPALLAMTLPTFAESETPRAPWAKSDPASDKVVHWVVDGCAAYPVTAEGPDQLASNIKPQAAAVLIPRAAPPSDDD